MKLVEILAREVDVFPEGVTTAAHQSFFDNEVYWLICGEKSSGCVMHCFVSEKAEDGNTAWVTRAQWEAERERILAESSKSTEVDKAHIAELTAIACGKRSKEDQALWDKVAIAVIGGVVSSDAFHNYPNFQGNPEVGAEFAAQMADAFMAERAKRLDNSHTTNSTNTDSPLKSSRVVL